MKIIAKILVLVFLASGIFASTSCRRYDDGPTISFNSPTKRLVRKWKSSKVTRTTNGTAADKTSDYNYTYDFQESGVAIKYDNLVKAEYKGTWVFEENDVILNLKGGGNDIKYTILRLKTSELWLTYVDGQDTWKIEMLESK
ncbi:MAG: hypothetical protein NTX03_00630 [Bacteroidetes bacterium]|nr:hypothetical protein [Bacteroidota bacterium]